MLKFFLSLLEKSAFAVARMLPKRNRVVLRGYPAFEDNILAIYQSLSHHDYEKIVWVVDNTNNKPPLPIEENTTFVGRGGLKDIYYCLTSRFLYITHGHFLRTIPENQICINLWHGIPLKKIGTLLGDEGRSDTFVVATSEFTRSAYADAFGMPEERTIVTGQARTDRLLELDKEDVWRRMYPHEPMPAKLILWLPTYRETNQANGRLDGEVFGNIFNCSDFSEEKFNAALVDCSALCLVKPHPMARRTNTRELSNLRYIDDDWLSHKGLSLYQLLGGSDCLISDISSVIADYLLLDRPILLIFEDIAAYSENRGFTFEPIEKYLPGRVTRNFSEFMTDLTMFLADRDPCAEQRKDLCDFYFDHPAGGASGRIIKSALSAGQALEK